MPERDETTRGKETKDEGQDQVWGEGRDMGLVSVSSCADILSRGDRSPLAKCGEKEPGEGRVRSERDESDRLRECDVRRPAAARQPARGTRGSA